MKMLSKPMSSVFNSLGSNYNWGFVWRSMAQCLRPSSDATTQLVSQLETEFHGSAIVTYKGRDAIDLALRATTSGLKPDPSHKPAVITQAFSCLAVEEAIVRAGCQPVYCDLAADSMVVSLDTVQQAWTQAKTQGNQPVAVVVQHTLGVAAPIAELAEWAKEKKLIVIEDLASALGGVDANGVRLGSYGDVVILSFGRDKVWDAVSGGAAVFRSLQLAKVARKIKLLQVPQVELWRDLSYPVITWLIRKLHFSGLGQLLFLVMRGVRWLRSPVASAVSAAAALPAPLAALALYQWQHLAADITHRRQLAQVYQDLLPTKLQLLSPAAAAASSQVRYSIAVSDPATLIKHLKSQGFFVSDRWYRQAVDGGSVGTSQWYQPGSCPRAEWLAQHIINLPTHRNISQDQVIHVAQLITEFESQNS